MKKDCSIVRDLLPLYAENMVSEETKDFVEAHLSKCPECNAIYASMTAKDEGEIADGEEVRKKILPLRMVKRKLLCRKLVASAISVAVLLVIVIVVGVKAYKFVDGHNKLAYIDYGTSEIYNTGEIKEVVYKKVLPQIYSFGFGYDIISIRYAGDEESLAAQQDASETYETCMAFNVEIITPAWAKPIWGFKPSTYYENIKWCVFIDHDNGMMVQIWDPPYIPPEQ